MAKFARAFLYVLLLLILTTSIACAIPSFRGYTGLMVVPTADALGKGDWNAGLFFEDVASGTINDYIANYGISDGLEIGLDRFQFDDDSDGKILLNGKYEFLPETARRAGVAGGIIDLADDLEATAYVVASKSLTSKLGTYRGEIITPRVHVGFGGGILRGLFAGVSTYLGNRFQVMLEWDSRQLNAGARFRLTPGLTVHAGFFNIADRESNNRFIRSGGSFGVGLSYSQSY